jgi:hypothetical protein
VSPVDLVASYRVLRSEGFRRENALRRLAFAAGLEDEAVRVALAEGQARERDRVRDRAERRALLKRCAWI